MNSIKKSLYDNYKAAAEVVMPNLTNNNFVETGMLTKEDFKHAGDHLISIDSGWKWRTSGSCLVKENIICREAKLYESNHMDNPDDFDMSIYEYNNENTSVNVIKTETDNTNYTEHTIINDIESDSDDDLAHFEDETLIPSDAATIKTTENVYSNHVYNVYITYDQYYRTPRVWFVGSKRDGSPLTQEETYKDFMAEYLSISLTMEKNTEIDMHCVSVHPCKHAYAMQRMFAYEMEKKNASEIKINEYLIHFLKFASSVIPQLEFDITTL